MPMHAPPTFDRLTFRLKLYEGVLTKAFGLLGSNSLEIANALHEKKQGGIPYGTQSCPIKFFIEDTIGAIVAIRVNYEDVMLRFTDSEHLVMKVPPVVVEFMKDFDSGVYPYLIRHRTWKEIKNKYMLL